MPPRYSYWTILAGGLPTAFRAAKQEELLPTFKRIKDKHPDAEMKWFARGKLWSSPEDARNSLRDPHRGAARRPPREKQDARGREWRPGGEHRDPRQRFKDEKKSRNRDLRQQRWERKHRDPAPRDTVPHGTAPRATAGPARPPRERPHGDPLRKESRGGHVRRNDRPSPFAKSKGAPRERRAGERPFKPSYRRPLRGSSEPPSPPIPPGPDHEPLPSQEPPPEPPPRPSEPVIAPPGPPERGRRPRS